MHRHRLPNYSTAIAVLLLAAALASGCGLTTSQRAAIRSFSQATAALGESTSDQFVQIRNGTIRMNAARAELSAPGPIARPLEGQASIAATVVRTQATTTLHDYGDLLQALVDDTQEKELQTASDRFVAAVRGLPSSQKVMDDVQLAAVGQAVQAAGGLLVEYMKKRAIKDIVPRANPQVAKLCDLLAADFDPDGGTSGTDFQLGADYVTAANELQVAADTSVKRAKDPSARAAATAAYELATTNRARRTVLLQARTAALELKAANQKLSDAIASDAITMDDVKSYAATVKTLVDTIKALQ